MVMMTVIFSLVWVWVLYISINDGDDDDDELDDDDDDDDGHDDEDDDDDDDDLYFRRLQRDGIMFAESGLPTPIYTFEDPQPC